MRDELQRGWGVMGIAERLAKARARPVKTTKHRVLTDEGKAKIGRANYGPRPKEMKGTILTKEVPECGDDGCVLDRGHIGECKPYIRPREERLLADGWEHVD